MSRFVDKCKKQCHEKWFVFNFWHESELLVESKKPVILSNVIGRQRRYILIKLHHVVSIYLCGSTAITPPYFLACFTFT